MIIEYVLAEEGLYLDEIELTLDRVRMEWQDGRFAPAVAERISGVIHLSFADLAAIFRQPNIIKGLRSGIDAIAHVDLSLANATDGGMKLVGTVDVLGLRIPISTATNLRIEDGKLIISAGKLEGLPLIGALPFQPLDLVLPLVSPMGMRFTGVSTAPGEILLEIAGTDFDLHRPMTGPAQRRAAT